MISYALIVLAACFNAVMDATENDVKFNQSIFSHLNKRFWLKSVSWQYAKKIAGWKADAWHISKSLMLICLFAAVYCEQFSDQIWHTRNIGLNILLDLCMAGLVWNYSFNLFYHKLFRVP